MTKDRSLVHIALYAALIAALGLMPKFDIPIAAGIPVTAQSLGIMLAGIMLGPVRGALAVLLFLFVVALGAPLLAGGRGGLGAFAGPSVGFLVGFPVAAFVCGLVMRATRALPVFPAALAAAIGGGVIVLYAFGISGLALMAGLDLDAAARAVTVFIPGDLIKAVAAAMVAQSIARGLPSALISRT